MIFIIKKLGHPDPYERAHCLETASALGVGGGPQNHGLWDPSCILPQTPLHSVENKVRDDLQKF